MCIRDRLLLGCATGSGHTLLEGARSSTPQPLHIKHKQDSCFFCGIRYGRGCGVREPRDPSPRVRGVQLREPCSQPHTTHAHRHTQTHTHTHTQMKGAFRHGTKLNTERHMGGRGVATRLPPGGMRFANPIQELWVLRPFKLDTSYIEGVAESEPRKPSQKVGTKAV